MQTPNIIPFHPAGPNPGFGPRLSLGRELAEAFWDVFRIKVTPSILCALRKEGLPNIRLSERQFRYDITAGLEWMLKRKGVKTLSKPENLLDFAEKLNEKLNESNVNKGA